MARKKILIFDASETSLVGLSWKIGSFIFRYKFDYIIAATNWDDVLNHLQTIREENKNTYLDVQLWSHGTYGKPLLNGIHMPYESDARVMIPDRWWFRCCYVFGGKAGHNFANYFSNSGVHVAGHTSVIGYKGLQPYLYALKPGDVAWWNVAPLDANKPNLFAPRTVTALRMSLPKWSYEGDKINNLLNKGF